MKKQTKDETMMEMNPTDYSRKDITEYVTEIVCVNKDIDTIRYRLLRIFAKLESCSGCSISRYIWLIKTL